MLRCCHINAARTSHGIIWVLHNGKLKVSTMRFFVRYYLLGDGGTKVTPMFVLYYSTWTCPSRGAKSSLINKCCHLSKCCKLVELSELHMIHGGWVKWAIFDSNLMQWPTLKPKHELGMWIYTILYWNNYWNSSWPHNMSLRVSNCCVL